MSNSNQHLAVSPSLSSHSGSFRSHSFSSQQHYSPHQHQHSHSMSDMTPNFPSSAPRGHAHSRSHSQIPQTLSPLTPMTPQSASLDSLQYNQHQDQTTLVFGVLNYMERLEREIRDMREFVNLGFRQLNDMGEHDTSLAARVENNRLQARNWNRINVTELDEPFKTLPTSNGDFPSDIPGSGATLRDSPHKVIDHMLDMYDIPFIPTMFLAEKKMLYLRFVGANRVIMHRILD